MKIKLFLLLLFFSNCYLAMAQEDDEMEVKNDIDSEQTVQTDDTSEAMRLKKGYALGDGLTLESASTWLNFTQSLQLLAGVSSTDDFDTYSSEFNMRRARFNFRGTLFNEKVYVRLRVNLVGNYQSTTTGSRSYNGTLQDALIEYRPTPNHRINFGVRANYDDSREARIEGESLGFIERSAISTAFDPIFDYGIRYYGIYRFGGNVLKPYVSVTTGDGTSALQKNYGGLRYGIRLDYLPFGTFTKGGEYFMDDLVHERLPKLIIGPTFSYNDGISSAKGTNGGRYIYGDANQNELLPDLIKTGIDYMFKYRGWYSLGEYVYTHATVPSGIAGEFSTSGKFTPYTGQTPEQIEKTVLSRLNVGSGFNVQVGYCFSTFALSGRYSYLENDPNSSNFADMNRYYSCVGTFYFSGHNLKLQTEVGYQEYKDMLKTPDVKGNIYGQIMFTIQL
ncbi:hypothetical protein [Flavobacterium anhuiense]|uniref:hypothetical protein n=1 Tax=Flavobacterium anhuiense TaxID=459526 RepID=UPI003D98C90F